MRARGWVVAGVLGLSSALAVAEPKPVAVDIKAFKSKLLVFQDAHGGTYLVLHEADDEPRIWYGAGKQLYEQRIEGRSANGDAWTIETWAPRLPDMHPAGFWHRADGTYFKQCDGLDDAELTQLTGDKAAAVFGKVQVLTSAFIHLPHLLARDDSGVYYYVDKLAKVYGGNGYRVFVGRKGALKLQTVTDIASDSAGQVFATKGGELRLVNDTSTETSRSPVWIRGEKRTELTKLDVDVNSPLIFSQLGVYKFLGSLCDDI